VQTGSQAPTNSAAASIAAVLVKADQRLQISLVQFQPQNPASPGPGLIQTVQPSLQQMRAQLYDRSFKHFSETVIDEQSSASLQFGLDCERMQRDRQSTTSRVLRQLRIVSSPASAAIQRLHLNRRTRRLTPVSRQVLFPLLWHVIGGRRLRSWHPFV